MKRKGEAILVLIKIFCVLAQVALVSSCTVRQKEEFDYKQALPEMMNQAPKAIPILRLEKPKYVLGESIRFWIGVKCLNDDVIIPEEYWDTCFLYITRPDGTVKTKSVSWPIDGQLYRGWSGGWGFGKEKVQIGKYTLVFEFANKKTEPVELIVEELGIIKQITAAFDFRRSGDIIKDTHVPVILTVRNNSKNQIHFPRRGVSDAYISIRVEREKPARMADFFYPLERLRNPLKKDVSKTSFDTYNWNVAAKVPPIILRPGERFEQELSLEDAYKFWGPGQYNVTFFTTLALLIGEKNGKFAAFCPIRFPVVGIEHFNIQETGR